MRQLQFSIRVPVLDEKENLQSLYDEMVSFFDAQGFNIFSSRT